MLSHSRSSGHSAATILSPQAINKSAQQAQHPANPQAPLPISTLDRPEHTPPQVQAKSGYTTHTADHYQAERTIRQTPIDAPDPDGPTQSGLLPSPTQEESVPFLPLFHPMKNLTAGSHGVRLASNPCRTKSCPRKYTKIQPKTFSCQIALLANLSTQAGKFLPSETHIPGCHRFTKTLSKQLSETAVPNPHKVSKSSFSSARRNQSNRKSRFYQTHFPTKKPNDKSFILKIHAFRKSPQGFQRTCQPSKLEFHYPLALPLVAFSSKKGILSENAST